LATGPHVDIRISKGGKYVDWEHMRAPRTITLNASQRVEFNQDRDRFAAVMDAAAAAPMIASVPAQNLSKQ
ncbi:MAG: hypothetical protein ABI824_15705, partial [Acidobacteriota bacterium]